MGLEGQGCGGSSFGGLLHIMGQGRRFLTFDQRWLGLGCRGPGGSLEQEDTVQGSRGQSPLLGRVAQDGLPKRSDAQRREFSCAGIRTEAPGKKLHESPANFTRCPEASPGPRRPGILRRPHSPGQRRPGSARRAREPLGAWGALLGVWCGPLTISTWRGSSWLGGAGTENWIFLRSLGSMAGVMAGGAGGA